MSVRGLREARLVRDKSQSVLRFALASLSSPETVTPPTQACRASPMSNNELREQWPRVGTQKVISLSSGPCVSEELWHCRTPLFDNYQACEAGQSEDDSQEQRPSPAQLSYVYLKLREEIPAFFSGHHSYDLYAPSMRYENHLSVYPWKGQGVDSYRLFLLSSRLALQTVCSQCAVDLMKITKDTEGGRVEARWRVRGRYSWTRRHRVIMEGFSTFQVNSAGLISIHKLSRVMPPSKDPVSTRALGWLAQLGSSRKLPQPEI